MSGGKQGKNWMKGEQRRRKGYREQKLDVMAWWTVDGCTGREEIKKGDGVQVEGRRGDKE